MKHAKKEYQKDMTCLQDMVHTKKDIPSSQVKVNPGIHGLTQT